MGNHCDWLIEFSDPTGVLWIVFAVGILMLVTN